MDDVIFYIYEFEYLMGVSKLIFFLFIRDCLINIWKELFYCYVEIKCLDCFNDYIVVFGIGVFMIINDDWKLFVMVKFRLIFIEDVDFCWIILEYNEYFFI